MVNNKKPGKVTDPGQKKRVLVYGALVTVIIVYLDTSSLHGAFHPCHIKNVDYYACEFHLYSFGYKITT
jgi:hypothetical protein